MLKKIILCGLLIVIFNLGFSKDFSDYSFLLKVSCDIGFTPSGAIIDQELNSYSFTMTYEDGTSMTGKPSVNPIFLDISGEYLIDNFGIVLSYSPININENASVGGSDNYKQYSYGGALISGNSIYIGADYHFPFNFPFLEWCGSFYLGAKAGYLNGTLSPYVSLVNFLQTNPINPISVTQPTVGVSGYSICPTTGVNFLFGFFDMSLALSYYIDNYTASQDLGKYYNYSGTGFSISYLALEFSIGVAF